LKIKVIVLCCAVFTLLFVSCKTAPKTVSETEPAAPAEENVNEKTAPVEEKTVPVEEKTPAVDNTAAFEKADKARESAIAAGADKLGTLFDATEKRYADVKQAGNSGKDVSVELADITARYQALGDYVKALAAKQRVDELNYSSYDVTDYNKGEEAIKGLDVLFCDNVTTGNDLFTRASVAYSSYDKVLIIAFKKLASDERSAAFSSKRNADGVKAGVAAKDDYIAAIDEFRAGDTCYSSQDPETALGHYQKAHKAFDIIYQSVSEKRAQAQTAIDTAKQKAEESAGYAVKADETDPITNESQQGIEAPDAVLLESETYDDPKTSEADIPETIDSNASSSINGTQSAGTSAVDNPGDAPVSSGTGEVQ
jgi:hypothetical protein